MTFLPLTRPRRFNKRREDFPDLRAYNDYLEMVEDISEHANASDRLADQSRWHQPSI